MLEIESDDPQDKERRWEDFWDALDFVRLQLEAPLQTSFSAVFEKLLPVRERLALPGATTRARITGGDATLGRIVAVDWSGKVFHASTVGRFQEALRAVAYQGDETEIISVMELLAFVVLACHRGPSWSGEVVLYVTDNSNVRLGLGCSRGDRGIGSLACWSDSFRGWRTEQNFSVHPFYIRTYRNQLADWLSREDLEQVRSQLAAQTARQIAHSPDGLRVRSPKSA